MPSSRELQRHKQLHGFVFLDFSFLAIFLVLSSCLGHPFLLL